MQGRLTAAILGLALTSSLASQTGVAPPTLANNWGTACNLLPWGQSGMRWQQLYEAAALPPGLTRRSISQLGFRRCWMAATNRRSFALDTEVSAFSVPFGQAAMSATFATNRGAGTGGVVFTRKILNLPLMPLGSPASSFHVFPLDNAHVFNGPNLLLEVVNFGAVAPTDWFVDMCFVSGNAAANIGTKCGPTENLIGSTSTTGSAGNYSPGSTVTVSLGNGPGSAIAFSIAGTNASQQGSVQLPLDLTAAGAPGCSVYTNLVLLRPVVLDGLGSGSVPYPLPNDPNLSGSTLNFQWLNIDPAANPLGVSFSALHRVTLGPVTCPMANVFRLMDNLDTAGTQVWPTRGQVLRLAWF